MKMERETIIEVKNDLRVRRMITKIMKSQYYEGLIKGLVTKQIGKESRKIYDMGFKDGFDRGYKK